MAEERRTPPRVHVYAQGAYHDDVLLIGDKAGLHALCQAVVSALRDGRGHSIVFAADGEGFDVHCVLLEADDGRWDRLRLPYTDEAAADRRRDAVEPWEIVRETAQRRA
jgi:hypothetical protein